MNIVLFVAEGSGVLFGPRFLLCMSREQASGGTEVYVASPLEQEILNALEGSTALVDCVGTDVRVCERACYCASRPLFLTLQNRIDAVLNETTLFDLTEDYREQKRRNKDAKSLS